MIERTGSAITVSFTLIGIFAVAGWTSLPEAVFLIGSLVCFWRPINRWGRGLLRKNRSVKVRGLLREDPHAQVTAEEAHSARGGENGKN